MPAAGVALMAAAWLLPAVPASADRVRFHDGGALEGRVEVAADGTVTLRLERTAVSYPLAMVREIDWGRSPDEEYAERAGALDAGDVGGHSELARWCRERHMQQAYVKELLAVARELPTHSLAQELSHYGYVMRDGQWVSLEYHMLKEGRVQVGGEWLTPDEAEARRAAGRKLGDAAGSPPLPPAPAARPDPAPRAPSARGTDEPPIRAPRRRRRYQLILGPGGGLIDRP